MLYLYLKSLHIIFIVTWFAGLFYIVRLFVYHAEAEEKPEEEKNILQAQYKIMETRLWYGITWPSMILTFILGFWTAYTMFEWDFPAWLLLKTAFVLGLTFYHFYCHSIYQKFQRNLITFTSMKLRILNEVATLFLVAIVFLVVMKGFADLAWGVAGFAVFSLILFAAIKIYKKVRDRD